MTQYDWMDDALCRQVSPEIFHPTIQETSLANKAKAVCANCPVIDACLEYALGMPGVTGIYAGTNEKERRLMRRRREQNATQGNQGVRDTSTAGQQTSIRIPTR